MRLIRLLILFGNIALIITAGYLGCYFFLPGITGGSGYFDYKQIVTEPPDKYLPNEPPKKGKEESQYNPIIEAFVPFVPPPPVIIAREEVIETDLQVLKTQVQVKSIVYNPFTPSLSGIHVLVSNVPRYFACGDNEPLSRNLNFTLAGIKEVAVDEEYLILFRKTDGKIVEFPHKRTTGR